MEALHTSNAVYMLASRKHGAIYIGVTSELSKRIADHKVHARPGFTAKYGVTRLVWYERHYSIVEAIHREKQLKRYKREWKINLIEQDNPDWNDLFDSIA